MQKCGSETWITRILTCIVNEIRFLRRTAGYATLNRMGSTDILEDLEIYSTVDNIQSYRNRWRSRVERLSSETTTNFATWK